jgi:cytochrome c oxidase subunit 2
MAALTYVGLTSAGLLPSQASEQARSIDWLWDLQVKAISFLFALIVVPLLYSLVVFRRRRGDSTDAAHMEGNIRLEVTWTVLPLFAVLALAYLGAYSLGETRRVDPQAMTVKVTGFQWSWKFEYPVYGITTTELYLPVDHQVVLKMESPDVIHSFWVPEFRIKQDVVPGRVTEYRVTPNLIGKYKVRCAELCGTAHSYMESPVVVTDAAEFEAWVAQQQELAASLDTPEERGASLAAKNACAACHTTTGAEGIGPTWRGLFESDVVLSDGTTVVADEAYLTESILQPAARLVQGYPPSMPPFGFTAEELADIVAYLKTLK